MRFTVSELAASSGVKFGTSGARGLAVELTDRVAYAYTRAFLQFLRRSGQLANGPQAVAVGGDYRPSTDRIMAAVMRSASDAGFAVVHCGKVPSPAVALAGLQRRIPAIMVTGSHIPDDRNGIKFNKPAGEILKEDEVGISAETLELDDALFTAGGAFASPGVPVPAVEESVRLAYVNRYLTAFPANALRGLRIAVYQHSAVGRDVLVEILQGLGATLTPVGRSDRFIPVDTEAVRPEDVELARKWAADGQYDAVVSADGDSDRPLVSDECGEWLRGDVAGILTARFLGADSVSTPVSSNSALEATGWFAEVRRTRIGSPFVVASMLAASTAGRQRVVGYEANGGFLLNSGVDLGPGGARLGALPTRDAVIVLLGVLLQARREGRSIRESVAALPARFTASDRLKEFPLESSRRILERFGAPVESANIQALQQAFGPLTGSTVAAVDRTDGIRVTFANHEVVHLRPSGNAPEFRCYTEASSAQRAGDLCARGLEILRRLGGA